MGVKLLLAGWYGGELTPPDAPRPWLRKVERWVHEAAEELLESSRTVEGPQGPILFLRLHPAAGDVAEHLVNQVQVAGLLLLGVANHPLTFALVLLGVALRFHIFVIGHITDAFAGSPDSFLGLALHVLGRALHAAGWQ